MNWPSTSGVGVNLSYGLIGSAIYAGDDESRQWLLPKTNDNDLNCLYKVDNSKQLLIKNSEKVGIIEEKTNSDSEDGDIYVPRVLLKDCELEDQIFNSKYIYDPISMNCKLFDIGKPGVSNKQYYVYASGEFGTILSLSKLTKDYHAFTKENCLPIRLNSMTFGETFSIELQSPIRQIVCSKSSSEFEINSRLIIIRTAIYIKVFRFTETLNSHKSHFKELATVYPADLSNNTFADVTYNPYDPNQFAMVDTEGVWGVYEINPKNIKHSKFVNIGRIFDPFDHSKFKQVQWSEHFDFLFVISRVYIKKVKISTGFKTDLLLLTQFSQVCCFERLENNDKLAMLLTSRELMIVDLNHGKFKKSLSWRHFLNVNDHSLKFTIKLINDIYFVLVFSKVNNILLIFQFKYDQDENNLPVMNSNPISLNFNEFENGFINSFHLQQLTFDDPFLYEDLGLNSEELKELKDLNGDVANEFFVLLVQTRNLQIIRYIISSNDGYKKVEIKNPEYFFRNQVLSSRRDTSHDSVLSMRQQRMQERNLELEMIMLKRLDMDFSSVTNGIRQPQGDQQDSKVCQAVAKTIDFGKVKRGPMMLQELSRDLRDLQRLHRFDEYDRMVLQLVNFSAENELEVAKLHKLVKAMGIRSEINSFSQLYKYLCEQLPSEDTGDLGNAVKRLMPCLFTVANPSAEEDDLHQLVLATDEKVVDIFTKWDSNYEDEETELLRQIETRNAQRFETIANSQSQQPVINSQSQPVMSSQDVGYPASSQSVKPELASSRHKHAKKRKRIKGFG